MTGSRVEYSGWEAGADPGSYARKGGAVSQYKSKRGPGGHGTPRKFENVHYK